MTTATHELPPLVTGGGLLGSIRAVQRDTLLFLVENSRRYGGLFRFRASNVPVYVVAAPEAIQRVLVENAANYSKNTFTYRGTVSIIGESVFNSDGEIWVRKRRMLQPVFQSSRFQMLDGIVQDATTRAANRWQGGAIDAAAEMTHIALEVAARAFFGTDLGHEQQQIREAVTVLAEAFSRRYSSTFAAIAGATGLSFLSNRSASHAKQTLYNVVDRIVADQGVHGDSQSLASVLFEASDPQTGQRFSRSELQAEVLTLLIAGHETTAAALAWTWQLLAWHPEAQQRLRDEVTGILGNAPASMARLAELPYLRMVLDEALRLYPPAWGFTRRAEDNDVVMGYRIPKGARIIISPYVLHRREELWERPDEFVPERFAADVAQARSPYAYIPFGAGPRQCIGKRFALVEAQLILSNLIRGFRVSPLDPTPVEPVAHATLRPLRPIRLRVEGVG